MVENIFEYRNTLYQFLAGKNQAVVNCEKIDESLKIDLKTTGESSHCPKCGQESKKVVATYHRIVQDVPTKDSRVYLDLKVKKFACENPHCSQKIFVEQLDNVNKNSSRTLRLDRFILTIATFLNDNLTSLVLESLGIKISHDSIRRLRKRIVIKEPDEACFIDPTIATTVALDSVSGETLIEFWFSSKENTKTFLEKLKKQKLDPKALVKTYVKAIKDCLPTRVREASYAYLFSDLEKTLTNVTNELLITEKLKKDLESS